MLDNLVDQKGEVLKDEMLRCCYSCTGDGAEVATAEVLGLPFVQCWNHRWAAFFGHLCDCSTDEKREDALEAEKCGYMIDVYKGLKVPTLTRLTPLD